MKRTHTCGELTGANDGEKVELHGWVHSIRDHGGLLFVDLRDRYGHTQVVFRLEETGMHEVGNTLRPEWVIGVEGTVRKRTPENINSKVPTGEIEVEVERLTVHNQAITPPFEVRDDLKVGDDVRLQYRYIDLRRPVMQDHFVKRSKMLLAIRESMQAQGFIDIETPSMVKFTPGGARNFLVPSRHFPGQFFAMAESPQIFKQLFMVAGLDRYYQIARCWRDEDLRADRQLEFTQLDVEMSFVEPDDIMNVIEGVMKDVWQKVLGVEISPPFERIPYDVAVRDYGSDKPDLRFGMKIQDISDLVKDAPFKVFSGTVASGGVVRGLVAEGCSGWSRKQISDLETDVKGIGAKGLAWFKVGEEGLTGGPSKFFEPPLQKKIIEAMGAKAGDLLLFLADEEESCAYMLGWLRNCLQDILGLVKSDDYRFCWIVDFPMFEYSEEEEAWVARHHPFTMPRAEDLDKLQTDQRSVKARAYDLVLNGVEIGGGSIRIHQRDVQEKVFRALGLSEEYIRDRFQFLLDAFRYGAPPHGGIALGVDRLAMLVLGLESIRDTIAFPKTQRTLDLLTGAPTTVSERQLKDLHLKVVEEEG